jgi:hypothetical protein
MMYCWRVFYDYIYIFKQQQQAGRYYHLQTETLLLVTSCCRAQGIEGITPPHEHMLVLERFSSGSETKPAVPC